MHRSSTIYKQKQSTDLNKNRCIVERTTGDELSTGGSIIMNYGLVFWPEVMV